MKITSIGTAFPPNYYDQETLIAAYRRAWAGKLPNLDRIDQLHRSVQVKGRYLAIPLEEYTQLETWGKFNDAWIRVAQQVGEEAVRDALSRAGIAAGDVDTLIFVTVTGVSAPSIDAYLMNRLGLPARVKRTPIFGLGCVAGASGLARAADYLKAYPDQVAVVLAVELCSLTIRLDDLSTANVISAGLFGDGAAAVVMTGANRPEAGVRVLATRSTFYPDSERVMGWDISDRGFKIVLSIDVPRMARRHLPGDVDQFLRDHGLRRNDIHRWVAHTGGPRVLEAIQEGLELPPQALAATWRSLEAVGNLSSASVLLALEETMKHDPPPPGSLGLLMAMGPGFCSELVLLEW